MDDDDDMTSEHESRYLFIPLLLEFVDDVVVVPSFQLKDMDELPPGA